MVPSKEQERGNAMGDCYSKKESLKILKNGCEDHDAPVRALSDGVKSLYTGGMLGASTRYRTAMAVSRSINSYSYFVDNVDRVRKKVFVGESRNNQILFSKSTLGTTRERIIATSTSIRPCNW